MNLLKEIYDNNINDFDLYNEDSYLFDNIEKLINNNYRKDDKEFHEIFSILRYHYIKSFSDYIDKLSEFYFEISLLYLENIEEKYNYQTIKKSLYFINKIRTFLKLYLIDSNTENINLKLLELIKEEIKSKSYNSVFGDLYSFRFSKIGCEEYKELGEEKNIDFLFPGLIWDDDLYSGFCTKYLYMKSSDYELLDESYKINFNENIESYNQKLKKIKESTN